MNKYPRLQGRYSREDLEKIIGKAQELYGREQETIDHDTLAATAEELDIPRKYITQAIASLKDENAIREKSRRTRSVVIGAGAAAAAVVAVIVVVALVNSTPANRLQSMRDRYYNQAAALDEAIKTQSAQVDNVIRRRFELVPKLTDLVREYAQSEKEILLELGGAREAYERAPSLDGKAEALGRLDQALLRITRTAQARPEMQSAGLYRDLMAEVAGSDNRIAVERKRYNDAVGAYNRFVRQYPLVEYIEALGFAKERAYWNYGE